MSPFRRTFFPSPRPSWSVCSACTRTSTTSISSRWCSSRRRRTWTLPSNISSTSFRSSVLWIRRNWCLCRNWLRNSLPRTEEVQIDVHLLLLPAPFESCSSNNAYSTLVLLRLRDVVNFVSLKLISVVTLLNLKPAFQFDLVQKEIS